MKVVHLNTYKNFGGAAIAGNRTVAALNHLNPGTASMLNADDPGFRKAPFVHKLLRKASFAGDVFTFSLQQAKPSYKFRFSLAAYGSGIHHEKEILSADIIHIHWINHGFLSLEGLKKIFALNKPVVWTLHDMWPFTGGCHYSAGCDHFISQCGNCFYLREAAPHDVSFKIKEKKEQIFSGKNMASAACSNWLADTARTSAIGRHMPVLNIPNPIDTEKFRPLDKAAIKREYDLSPEKKIILFGAANINEERKGLNYLVAALQLLKKQSKQDIEILIIGKNKGFDESLIPFKVHMLGKISDEAEMVRVYNLADIFVLPSLEDNLPNMVMEALACGTPVTAFDTGGLSDLITHQNNGYLAKYKSAEDLCKGMNWILENSEEYHLPENSREKVLSCFSNQVVAQQYFKLYETLLNGK